MKGINILSLLPIHIQTHMFLECYQKIYYSMEYEQSMKKCNK